jgi:hypothetical protein
VTIQQQEPKSLIADSRQVDPERLARQLVSTEESEDRICSSNMGWRRVSPVMVPSLSGRAAVLQQAQLTTPTMGSLEVTLQEQAERRVWGPAEGPPWAEEGRHLVL